MSHQVFTTIKWCGVLSDGYKSWLALGIQELGRDEAGEVESDWMVPLLVEEERDRLMAWQLGVSIWPIQDGVWLATEIWHFRITSLLVGIVHGMG